MGQNSCNENILSEMEKKFSRADKKGKTDNYEYADISFKIAECYRLKNDSNNLKWYRKNIRVGKNAFKSCDKDKIAECNRTIGQIGISQYYIGQYEESIKYLEKAAGYSKNPDFNYFLGLSYMKLEKYDIASVEFNNFKRTSTDIKDVEILLKICQDKLKENPK